MKKLYDRGFHALYPCSVEMHGISSMDENTRNSCIILVGRLWQRKGFEDRAWKVMLNESWGNRLWGSEMDWFGSGYRLMVGFNGDIEPSSSVKKVLSLYINCSWNNVCEESHHITFEINISKFRILFQFPIHVLFHFIYLLLSSDIK